MASQRFSPSPVVIKIIDLSQEIHPGMQLFPAFPKPVFVHWTKRETYGFETEALFLVTHTGTHVDAPYHFYAPGAKVDELPLEKLIGDGVVLDFSNKAEKSYITASDIREAESRAKVQLKKRDILLVRTGWDRHLGRERYVSAYPGLSQDAANYLVGKKVGAVGVDDPSPDHPDASDFVVHNTLLPEEILIVENLANLSSISRPRFRFIGIPLRIRGGTGSPIRAVAMEEEL